MEPKIEIEGNKGFTLGKPRKNGSGINFSGVDYEAPLSLFQNGDEFQIYKVPGRMCWSGRGQYRYESPSFIITQIKKREMMNKEMMDIWYSRFEIISGRGLAKKAKAKAIEIWKRLSDGETPEKLIQEIKDLEKQ